MGNQQAQSTRQPQVPQLEPYYAWLQCPACKSDSLSKSELSQIIECKKCGSGFPVVPNGNSSIPFLFSPVTTAFEGWIARLNGFNQTISHQINELARALRDKRISKLSCQRIKSQLNAKKVFKTQINSQLQFFASNELSQYESVNGSLAKNQGIDSYINNIFRDWAWDNGENEELIQAIGDVYADQVGDAGNVLTIGAGASRFSFDFHYAYNANHSLLLDINPFLLLSANRIINRKTISLYEFPVAPASIKDYAVLQQCKIPEKNDNHQSENFSFILADAANIPFTENTFDTILTPWLIDILPFDLREFIPHVNRVLKKGGVWINSGTLAFFHKNEDWNYSEEEVIDLLGKYGFEVICTKRRKISYMHSPHSTHGRIETIFSFSARKKFNSVPAKPHQYLPSWITNSSLAIPQKQELIAVSSKYLLQAQVLSAIDGSRSIDEIGTLLAKQYGMSEESATAAVRQILTDNYQRHIG